MTARRWLRVLASVRRREICAQRTVLCSHSDPQRDRDRWAVADCRWPEADHSGCGGNCPYFDTLKMFFTNHHPLSDIISVVSFCLFVYHTITFKSIDVKSLYWHIRYISREYGSSSYMKVIGPRSRSQEQKGRKSLFPQCKTLIGNNSCSVKHRVIKFAPSMEILSMADRTVWPPSLSRDPKWPRVTKCTYSRVVGLRLQGNVVFIYFFTGKWR